MLRGSTLLVKYFKYVKDKGFEMADIEYEIDKNDVLKKIHPPVIKHNSKRRVWCLFRDRDNDLNVSEESYSGFFHLTF